MEETKKRTERKSQSIRSRILNQKSAAEQEEKASGETAEGGKASRVVDMSWAAAYLDDEWENKYSKEGGYDTKSAGLVREDIPADTSEHELAVDLLSQTQEFKAVEDQEGEDEESLLKIRDAVTDKTIISLAEAEQIRAAASRLAPAEEEAEDLLKIRDAVTDKTIVSVNEMDTVRDTVVSMGLDEDLEDLEKIRDARHHRTNKEEVQKEKQPEDVRAADTGITIRTPVFVSEKKKEEDSVPSVEQFISSEEVPSVDAFIQADVSSDTMQMPPVEAFVKEQKKQPRQPRRQRREEQPSAQSAQRRKERPRREEYYEDYLPVKSPLRFIPLVLVIAICVFGYIAARTVCYDIPINASDYSKMTYTVSTGLTDEQLSQDLMDMGLIDNPLVFRLRCLFYDADYQEGTYELSPCYSTEKIINILSGYQYGE